MARRKRGKTSNSTRQRVNYVRPRQKPLQLKFLLGPGEAQTDLVLEAKRNVPKPKLPKVPKRQPIQQALSIGPGRRLLSLSDTPDTCRGRAVRRGVLLKKGQSGHLKKGGKRSKVTCK